MPDASAKSATTIDVVTPRLGTAYKGATAVEYGLLVALIAAVIVGAVAMLGNNLSSLLQTLATIIQ